MNREPAAGNGAAHADRWSQWLLGRRDAGDARQREIALTYLAPIGRDRETLRASVPRGDWALKRNPVPKSTRNDRNLRTSCW
jgi:hypothetical protein